MEETRDIKKRIKAVQERLRRRGEVEDVQMIGYAVATDRFEIDRLNADLKNTDRWLKYAIRHDVAVPQYIAYWEIEGGTDGTPAQSYLTPKGQKYIKEEVSKKRAGFWKQWSPLLSTLHAILSLIVAIIALWKSN